MKRVDKAWGVEHWITNTDKYCAKKLMIKRGWRCSVHYHRVKDETFYIERGRVLIEFWSRHPDPILAYKEECGPGDTFHILPGTPHRFTGLEDSLILEISTHHDDEDVVRIEQSGEIDVEAYRGSTSSYRAQHARRVERNSAQSAAD